MNSFRKIELADRRFNSVFVITSSFVISFALIGLLTYLGLASLPYCWVIYVILILLPVFTYGIVNSINAEYKMAFYKIWVDKILGYFDQYKILKDFAEKYKIANWRKKVNGIKVDKRWRFHVSTAHARELVSKRKILLNHLQEEYNQADLALDEMISHYEKDHEESKKTRGYLEAEEKSLGAQIKNANGAAAIYDLEVKRSVVLERLLDADMRVNEAAYRLNVAKSQKDRLKKTFENVEVRAKIFYYNRYRNYTSIAIKKINAVNGLKYTISEDMEEA